MKQKNIIFRIWTRLRKDGFPVILNILFSKYIFIIKPIVSPIIYESINMYLRLGYWPNLRKPLSLNEKIVNRKIFSHNPIFGLVADKVQVRQYISEKIDNKILNEIYFIGEDPNLIPFESLPSKFVIKANHGSGWNIIVNDKSTINKNQIISKCNYWLSIKYSSFSKGYEAHYDSISPRIIVERFLESKNDKQILDFKFFCFHGCVKFIAVDTDKNIRQNRYIYDTNWNLVDFTWPNFPHDNFIEKPMEIKEMISIAETLAQDFDFCRIDLYLSKDGVKFGEITISPGGGWDKISPKEWDFKLGELWKIYNK